MMYRWLSLSVLVILVGCTQPGQGVIVPKTYETTLKNDTYPLDGVRRTVAAKGRPNCPTVQLIKYKGDVIRYHRVLKINPFFKERLQHFELVLKKVAMDVYGRPPIKIRHYGGYLCRRIGGRPRKMSEHGLGNAIDISGFEFGPDLSAPRGLRKGFRVVLKKHWHGQVGIEATHARFLRKLVKALASRPDIFRGMLGPGAPGHDDHFHFDVGKWRFMKIKG